jgi:hypothetical protein
MRKPSLQPFTQSCEAQNIRVNIEKNKNVFQVTHSYPWGFWKCFDSAQSWSGSPHNSILPALIIARASNLTKLCIFHTTPPPKTTNIHSPQRAISISLITSVFEEHSWNSLCSHLQHPTKDSTSVSCCFLHPTTKGVCKSWVPGSLGH